MPRAFLYSLAGVNTALALAGSVYAARRGVPGAVAAPVVAAFLLQISLYLAAGIPAARRWIEDRLRPSRLALLVLAWAVTPYLVYSVPTGVFRVPALVALVGIAAGPALVFVACPARGRGLTWHDVLVLGTIAAAELTKVFRGIYVSPIEDLRVDILGRIMILGVGAMAYLSLRRLEGCAYRLGASWAEIREGVRQYCWFLPLGVGLGLAIGFAGFRPARVDWWIWPLLAVGTFLGIYLAVALFEELFLRGVLQNALTHTLGNPLTAQAVVSVLSGLAHLPFRDFPNWRFALLATLAHWFYGQAWRRGGIVAASVAHALVVTTWRLLFTG